MKRLYQKPLLEFIHKKIILITGPRQCGKTTLSKMLSPRFEYLNFDDEDHRQLFRERSWNRNREIVIFDELHKMKNWKQWIKAVYDVEGTTPSLVVTGSARLDTYRKVGDSLAGRYFQYRLHPLDLRELNAIGFEDSRSSILNRLLETSGFPEPFQEGNKKFYNLWKKTHLDIILRQDLVFQEDVRDLKSLELLIDLLKERVASPVSYSSLAEDLRVSDKTVKRWLGILEDMYVVFKILPFHKNIARSNQKQPKYYFFDTGRVTAGQGAKLENLVACSLLKECQFRQDCSGEEWDLYYMKLKGGKEIDFLLTHEGKAEYMVEVKLSDDTRSGNFSVFSNKLPGAKMVQIVKNLKKEKTYPDGLEIRKAENWLCDW